jgi:hypothetical protein
MDKSQTLGEFLGHLCGAIAAVSGDAPASAKDQALAMTFAQAESAIAAYRKQADKPAIENEAKG